MAVRAALAASVLLVLTGCGSAPDSPGSPRPASPGLADLAGRTFVTDTVEDPDRRVVPGSTIRIDFTEDRVGVRAGCNSMGGAAVLRDGRLEVTDLSTTDMGCLPASLMEQEQWVSAFLTSGPQVDLGEHTLRLVSGETRLDLDEELVMATPLEGSLWRLDTVYDGTAADAVASTPPRGAKASVRLRDGRLEVRTGCNSGSATAEVTGDTVRLGPLALTERGCPGALTDLEARFTRVLSGEVGYVIDGQRLTLTAADGSEGLGFRVG